MSNFRAQCNAVVHLCSNANADLIPSFMVGLVRFQFLIVSRAPFSLKLQIQILLGAKWEEEKHICNVTESPDGVNVSPLDALALTKHHLKIHSRRAGLFSENTCQFDYDVL